MSIADDANQAIANHPKIDILHHPLSDAPHIGCPTPFILADLLDFLQIAVGTELAQG